MLNKVFKICTVLSLVLVMAFVLAGCGFSQSYADKINAAAEAEKHLTKDKIYGKLGDPTVDAVIILPLVSEGGTGYALWIKDVKDLNDAKAKYDEGKELKMMQVLFANGKATYAKYGTYDPNADYSKK